MPRKKPTVKIGVYGKTDLNPEDAVQLYKESTRQNQFYIKKPYWDIARENLELTAIKNEREFLDFKKQQDEMRLDTIIQSKINKKRIREMRSIQEGLREKFIAVNDFIKECEEKEELARKKTEIEKVSQERIQDELVKIKDDMQILDNFEIELKHTLDLYKPYETVIETVINESDLFKSVKDLMDRCDALMIAQVEISELDQEKVMQIENMRQQMIVAVNNAALRLIGLNNELADLERSYNEAQNKALKWETILEKTKEYIASNELTTCRLNDCIRNLYNLLSTRNKEDSKIDTRNKEGMLDYIKSELEVLTEIVRIANVRVAKEQKSLLAEKGSKKEKNK